MSRDGVMTGSLRGSKAGRVGHGCVSIVKRVSQQSRFFLQQLLALHNLCISEQYLHLRNCSPQFHRPPSATEGPPLHIEATNRTRPVAIEARPPRTLRSAAHLRISSEHQFHYRSSDLSQRSRTLIISIMVTEPWATD